MKNLVKNLIAVLPEKWLLRLAELLFRVEEAKSEEQRNVFRNLWTEVWLEVGYAHNEGPLPEVERYYEKYDAFSTDLMLYVLWMPIGTLRLIRENDKAGLPLFNDFGVEKTWEGVVFEFELLTLKPNWRGLGHVPSLVLWREGYGRVKQANANIAAAVDWRFHKLLGRFFPVRDLGEGKVFQGSFTIPVFLDICEAQREVAQSNPALLWFFDPEAAEEMV